MYKAAGSMAAVVEAVIGTCGFDLTVAPTDGEKLCVDGGLMLSFFRSMVCCWGDPLTLVDSEGTSTFAK